MANSTEIRISDAELTETITRLDGNTPGTAAGYDLAGLGDVNGDGLSDFAVATPNDDALTPASVTVIFGRSDGWPETVDLGSVAEPEGFTIRGLSVMQYWQDLPVAAAGDVNGDGIGDMIVGDYPNDRAYVLFGRDDGFGNSIDLAVLSPDQGVVLQGRSGSYAGFSVDGAGDVNGDGHDDLIIGAWRDAGLTGRSFVVYGGPALADTVDLSALDGTDGFALLGAEYPDWSGRAVAGAGDFNGDGFDDVLIGAPDGSTSAGSAGQAYLVFGSDATQPAERNLATLDGLDGVRFDGARSGDNFGNAVAGAGDVNGDGLDDIVIGALSARSSAGAGRSGAAYVILGSADRQPAIRAIDAPEGGADLTLTFNVPNSALGAAVAGAGDLNGDGLDDVIVGAYDGRFRSTAGSGHAAIVLGRALDTPETLRIDALPPDRGKLIVGAAPEDRFGLAVAGAGDVDGDGRADLLIGAPQLASDYTVIAPPGKAYLLRDLQSNLNQVEYDVIENGTAVGTVSVGFADDATVTYAIGEGVDSAFFTIDEITGALSFIEAPDFELPSDAGANNEYDLSVGATDSVGRFVSLDVTVTVADENETPVFRGPDAFTVEEGQTRIGVLSADDPEGTAINYSLSGGADAGRFVINAATGFLRFVGPTDFEAPDDVGTDGTYNLKVTVVDETGLFVQSEVTVTLSDVDEAPVAAPDTAVVAEDGTIDIDVLANDTDPENAPLTILSAASANGGTVTVVGGQLRFAPAPDFFGAATLSYVSHPGR